MLTEQKRGPKAAACWKLAPIVIAMAFLPSAAIAGQSGDYVAVIGLGGHNGPYSSNAGKLSLGVSRTISIKDRGAVVGELAAIGPFQREDPEWFTFLSVGGAAYLSKKDAAVRPFLNGGYTFDFSLGHGWHIGAGTDLGAGRRLGIRIEVRDYVFPYSDGSDQFWAVRAGVVIRTGS